MASKLVKRFRKVIKAPQISTDHVLPGSRASKEDGSRNSLGRLFRTFFIMAHTAGNKSQFLGFRQGVGKPASRRNAHGRSIPAAAIRPHGLIHEPRLEFLSIAGIRIGAPQPTHPFAKKGAQYAFCFRKVGFPHRQEGFCHGGRHQGVIRHAAPFGKQVEFLFPKSGPLKTGPYNITNKGTLHSLSLPFGSSYTPYSKTTGQ